MLEVSPLRPAVLVRSQNCCEAMIQVGPSRVWTRCGRGPVDDHHMLTRARGGALLDEVGEIYHHLALCRPHHSEVDEYGFDSGLLIDGTVYRDADRLIYRGTDAYLSEKYPALGVPVLREALPGSGDDEGPRGDL